MKLVKGLGFFLLIVNSVFADDTIKVTVGTQTYHCELGASLDCKPANEVQQKTLSLKKNNGNIDVEDKPRNLSAGIVTSLNGSNVAYEVTLCSAQTCTISTVTSDATGSINQIISGQYNITQKSFDVLGFFIKSRSDFEIVDLQTTILNSTFAKKFRSRLQ